jgi:hypothetical protein
MADKSLELNLPDDYKPSAGELDNIVYLVCKYTIGWQMRQCDLAVCVMMAGGQDAIVGNAGLTKLVEVTCEYAWDHLSGEPNTFSPEQLFDHIKPALQGWYQNTDAEERAKTE